MNFLENWDISFFESDDQKSRIAAAPSVADRCYYFDEHNKSCRFLSQDNSSVYSTYTDRCSCPDFINRREPCKHMHFLNMHLNGQYISPMPKEYIVLDTETTGLSPKKNQIIELGAVKVSNGQIVDTFQSYIYYNKPLTKKIKELTGITDQQLAGAPEEEAVIKAFDKFAEDLPVVGHNVTFDLRFLGETYLRVFNKTIRKIYFDTLAMSREVFPDLEHHKLIDMANVLNIHSEHFHGAYDDAVTTEKVFRHLASSVDLYDFNQLFRYDKYTASGDSENQPKVIKNAPSQQIYQHNTPPVVYTVPEKQQNQQVQNKKINKFIYLINKYPVISSFLLCCITILFTGFLPEESIIQRFFAIIYLISCILLIIALFVHFRRKKNKK